MSDPDRLLTTRSVIDRQRPRDVRLYDHRRLSLPPICAVMGGMNGRPRPTSAVFRSFRATARFHTTAGKNGLRLSYQPCCCLAVISVPYVASQQESRQTHDGSCQKGKAYA
jgi:hypothetical protein